MLKGVIKRDASGRPDWHSLHTAARHPAAIKVFTTATEITTIRVALIATLMLNSTRKLT